MDKRVTIDEIVAELRPGMTVGLGGWGSRRKPMSVVRALCRAGIGNLTIVAYGGPDVGLLCATEQVRKVVCGFVTLDSIALDPHWRAARQQGRVEVAELDEGMFYLGLQAASWRVPFLPTRAGLGSDVLRLNPDLRTVRSPYLGDGPFPHYRLGNGPPANEDPQGAATEGTGMGAAKAGEGGEQEGEELVAVPAIHLDVAVVHANRADRAGNAQFLGPDPFFDQLFLGAATRRFVTAERVVDEGRLTDEGPLGAVTVHRLLTDGVAESPGGAHFTACPPDYGRDEAFQRQYTAAANDPESWRAFRQRYVEVDEAGYQAAVTEGADR